MITKAISCGQGYVATILSCIYTVYLSSFLLVSPRADAQSHVSSVGCSEPAIARHIQQLSANTTAFDALVGCGEATVESLIQIFTNESADPLLRRVTARVLSQIGTTKAISTLLAVASSNSRIADSAVRAIADINPKARAAVPVLVTALDSNRHLRLLNAILTALGRIDPGAQMALPALSEAFKTTDRRVRHQAMTLLSHLNGSARLTLPQLVVVLRDPDERIRAFAAYGLVQQGQAATSVTAPLVAALQDPSDRVRSMALTALGRIGSPEAMAAVLKQLRNPQATVRDTAAIVVSNLDETATAAVPVLIEALSDRDEWVSSSVAGGLGQIGPEARSAIPKLISLLWDRSVAVRGAAAYALGKIEYNNEAVVRSLLIRLRWERNLDVRDIVLQNLAQLTSEDVPLLIKIIQETTAYSLWQSVKEIDEATPQMRAVRADVVFYYGIGLLGELRSDQGSAQAAEFLDQLYASNKTLWDEIFQLIAAATADLVKATKTYVAVSTPVVCRIQLIRRFLWRCR